DWDVALPADQIRVTVSDGWVTLGGEVRTYLQKLDAAAVVRRLRGVRGVSDEITVRPDADPVGVQQAIQTALDRNHETGKHGITVKAEGHNVTLEGRVDRWSERRAAERVAAAAPGVSAVHDHLVVAPFG